MAAGRPREFDADVALDKAMNVFRQKGFEGASLPDLTEAMGINRPSLYAAFGNKEELFRKVIERYSTKSMELLHQALAEPTAKEAIAKILFALADGSACPKTPKGCLLVQGALVGGDDIEPIRRELAERRAKTEFVLRQRFERGIAEGDLPINISAADLAGYISTVMQGMSVQSSGGASPDELRNIATIAMKVF